MNKILFFSSLIVYSSALVSEVTDLDLKKFSEHLLSVDVNNAGKYVRLDVQGRTNAASKTDAAPRPLLSADSKVYEIPTVSKLIALYDNYDSDTRHNEVVTQYEKNEEEKFLDTVLKTPVMNYTSSWLRSRGYLGNNDLKSTLKDIWFTMYSRGQRKKSSSGFEHIFLGEIKNNQVSGFHNWVFFLNEEKENKLNYLGYMRKLDLPQKQGSLLKLHYNWGDFEKPVGTLLVGTSPELEMALYTTCFLVRPNSKCYINLGGKEMFIQTYKFRYGDKDVLASAYPGLV